MGLVEKFRWTLSSIYVTPLAVMICVFLMGGGHGTYTPTIILFPYAMLMAISEKAIGQTSLVLGLIQFTAYGLIIDLTKEARRGLLIGIILFLLHSLTTVFVLALRGETF